LFTIAHRKVQVTLCFPIIDSFVVLCAYSVKNSVFLFFEDSGLLECEAVLLVELFRQMKRLLFPSARESSPILLKMRQHNPLECWEPLAIAHSITFQETCIFSNSFVRNSDLMTVFLFS